MVELGFREIAHGMALRIGTTLERGHSLLDLVGDEARGDRRPVVMQDRNNRAGSMAHSLTSSCRSWASRFCSTTKTWSWRMMKSHTSSLNGNARMRNVSRCIPLFEKRQRLADGRRARAE